MTHLCISSGNGRPKRPKKNDSKAARRRCELAARGARA